MYKHSIFSIFKDYKILIDTCSILEDGFLKFISDQNMQRLKECDNYLIIPKLVIDELVKKTSAKEENLSKKAKNALEKLAKLQKIELIKVKGDKADSFADNTFLRVVQTFKLKHNICIITQDKKLSENILQISKQESVKTKYAIQVFSIEANGNLIKYTSSKVSKNDKFRYPCRLSMTANTKLIISYIPKEKDIVFTQNKEKIILKKELGKGGEGIVYDIENNLVAKIYFKEKLTQAKFEKLRLMVSKNITYQGICYPQKLLFNKNNEFIGFTMPAARGKNFTAFKAQKIKRNYPNMKKRDLVLIAINFLQKIIFLHEKNIILGDINPNNFLINGNDIYFVDTDSYQIESFPCPVGTIIFTSPEFHKKGGKYETELRTFEDEYFAIAVMLFMIMLPGQNPYAMQGSEDMVKNIINMNFSYPFKERSNKKTPKGTWKYMWSHLSYKIKEAFYHSFIKNGRCSLPKNRLKPKIWLELFKYYLEVLDNGSMYKNDPMSLEVFPTRLKKDKNKTYIICPYCKKNEISNEFKMCSACSQKKKIKHNKNLQNEVSVVNDLNTASLLTSFFKHLTTP